MIVGKLAASLRPSSSSSSSLSTLIRAVSSSSSSSSSFPSSTRDVITQQRQASSASHAAEANDETPSLTSKIAPVLADVRSRLFAVVHVNDRQWKVTAGDLIQLEGASPLEHGDKIKLEKVLAVGSANFSIFGRPLLPPEHVTVEATVVERSHTSPELYYRHFNHHQTKITEWRSKETTLLRIDSVRSSPALLSEHSTEETKEASPV